MSNSNSSPKTIISDIKMKTGLVNNDMFNIINKPFYKTF